MKTIWHKYQADNGDTFDVAEDIEEIDTLTTEGRSSTRGLATLRLAGGTILTYAGPGAVKILDGSNRIIRKLS